MSSSWQMDTGNLACRWSEPGQSIEYNPPWQEATAAHGSYLPPPPDFASHSPFGGPDWFLPHCAVRKHAVNHGY